MIQDSNAPSEMQPWVRQTEAEIEELKNNLQILLNERNQVSSRVDSKLNSSVSDSFTFIPKVDGTVENNANAIEFVEDITSSASVNVDGSITVGNKPEFKEGNEGREIVGSAPYFEVTPGSQEVNPVTNGEFFAPGTLKINDTSVNVNAYGQIVGNGLSISLNNNSELMGYVSEVLDVESGVIYRQGGDWVDGDPEDEIPVTIYQISLNDINESLFVTGTYVDVDGIEPAGFNFINGLIAEVEIDGVGLTLSFKIEGDNSALTYTSGGQASLNSPSQKYESAVSISGPGAENDYQGSRVSQNGLFVGPNGGSEYEAPSSLQASGLVTPIVNAKEKLVINNNGFFVQASQPTSPSDGDLWINPDAASQVWDVANQVKDVAEEAVSIAGDLAALNYQLEQLPLSPNYVINGAFDIWQRGTSFTGAVFTADRWATLFSTQSVTRSTDAPEGFTYSASISRSSGTGNPIRTRLEAADCVDLVNKNIYLSFWAKNTGNPVSLRAQISGADAQDNFATVTVIDDFEIESSMSSEWIMYSAVLNSPLPTIGANGIQIEISTLGESGGAPWSYQITGVQLQKDRNTIFRRNTSNTQAELAACQRYFFKQGGSTNWGLSPGFVVAGTSVRATIPTPVTMRAAPTIVDSNTIVRTGTSSIVPTARTINAVVTTGVQVSYTITGGTASAPAVVSHGNDLALSAEL